MQIGPISPGVPYLDLRKRYKILLSIRFPATTYQFEIQILHVLGFSTNMLSVGDSLECLMGPRNCYIRDYITVKGFKIKSAREQALKSEVCRKLSTASNSPPVELHRTH